MSSNSATIPITAIFPHFGVESPQGKFMKIRWNLDRIWMRAAWRAPLPSHRVRTGQGYSIGKCDHDHHNQVMSILPSHGATFF